MSKQQKKKKSEKEPRSYVFAVACIACLILIGSSIVLLISYAQGLANDAGNSAQQITTIASARLSETIDSYKSNGRAAAVTVAAGSYADEDQFKVLFQRTANSVLSSDVMFLRYFKGEEEFNSNGEPYDMSMENQRVLELRKLRRAVCAGVVEDREFSISSIAIVVPIDGCVYADSMVIFYPTSGFSKQSGNVDDFADSQAAATAVPESFGHSSGQQEDGSDPVFADSMFVGVCSSSGEVIAVLRSSGFPVPLHSSIFNVFRKTVSDEDLVNGLQNAIMTDTASEFQTWLNGEPCTVTIDMYSEGSFTPFFVCGVFEGEADGSGLSLTSTATGKLKDAVASCEASAASAAKAVEAGSYKDEEDFNLNFHKAARSVLPESVTHIRYFRGEEEFDSLGDPLDVGRENQRVLELRKAGKAVCAGVVEDREYAIQSVAVCVPIENCEYADSMVVFFSVSGFAEDMGNIGEEAQDTPSGADDEEDPYEDKPDSGEAILSEPEYEKARFMGVCSAAGEIVSVLRRDDFDIQKHNNIFEALRPLLKDKGMIDQLNAAVRTDTATHYKTEIGGRQCIVSVDTIDEGGVSTFFVCGVFDNDALLPTGYTVIRVLLGLFTILFILLIIITTYLILKHRSDLKRAFSTGENDEVLGCPNRTKFERTANEIINRNKATDFAIVVVDVNHYEYLNEQNGHEVMLTVLQHLKLLYSRLLQIDETYGYLNSGRFVMLLHYKEMETLENRLKSVASLASSHGAHLSGSFSIELYGGLYCTNKGLTPLVSKMIDLAVDAEKTTNYPYDFGTFRIYNELIHASNVQNDYIELHMDSALENRDFRVFYQPKYHILNNKPDGCEALVRWYNPEIDDYMQPGVFIPLFEANKFIVKLDKYVYDRVCEYVQDAMENNLPLVPVSVNVSRITATESDFVSYYSSVKEQHGIPDGFLAIEFTESFAYEDYDMLRDIVGTLHKNGFKCVIDDFGSGFSSYNILKELPMDEIKLDRFFIKSGFSNDRDLKILKSVIELGRSLNMKVTQEGVETLDQLALLRSLGCHVIQGYHYSRPLSLPAYLEFLESKGSRRD